MRIDVQVVDTVGVEGGATAEDAVDFISFIQQELRQIRPVLPGDASN